ncbi:MAG: hypothetical protein J6A39_08415 [Peptococcaceae bacterium]|nr:hypothetical protein [Peptococcaceae bacterium]
MDFEKKLKQRLLTARIFLVAGPILMAVSIWKGLDNEFFFAWGTALLVIGIVRLRQYRKVMASPEAMRAQEIAETDERNIMLSSRAKSWAFGLYVLICGTAVIVLEFMNQVQIATALAFSVCALLVLYWICYHMLKRKY